MSQTKTLVCDFETTVYEGQDNTQVWASACVEIGTEDVLIFHSIDETYDYFKSLNTDLICYYHNLKFDGEFILYYLMKNAGIVLTKEQIFDSVWGKDYGDLGTVAVHIKSLRNKIDKRRIKN